MISVFDIEVDTNLFITRLLCNKLYMEFELSDTELNQHSMMLFNAKILIGFVSFCAKVMWLG